MPLRLRNFVASLLPAARSRHQNVLAVELLIDCGMISGAGFPDSLAGGTLLEGETSAAVGKHPFNIAGSALITVGAEWNVHPFEAAAAQPQAADRTTVVNGTIGCDGFYNGAQAYVMELACGETLMQVRRTNS